MDVDEAAKPAEEATETTSEKPAAKAAAKKEVEPPTGDALPEVDVYLTLLVIIFLLDHKHDEQVRSRQAYTTFH